LHEDADREKARINAVGQQWGEQTMRHWVLGVVSTIALALPLADAAKAQSVEEFYRGKTVNLIVGFSPGGGYDTTARILAVYLKKHIPGNPTVVVQNMEGAGSLKATNYLYHVAPKDGTAIGTFSRGMPMEPLIGSSATQFDAAKFTWLGSTTNEYSVVLAWHTSPVKVWNDLLKTEFTVGGEGSGSDSDIYAMLLKNLFGAKIKLVTGYPGSAELMLAVERGELDGRASWSWSSLKASKPDWIKNKKVSNLVQLNITKNPELPDVPMILDLATTDKQRQILKVVLSRQTMGRPFAAPPGIPEDRKQALRKAFDDTMKDPEFLAEAQKRKMDVNPVSGVEVEKLVAELYKTPQDVIAEAKVAISAGK
jgi:tripartite-type tricarboxylate transporter receptor subunit TctC